VLYVALRDVPAKDNIDVEPGVSVDLDADGHIIGLEVLDATEKLGAEAPTSVTLEWLRAEQPGYSPWRRRTLRRSG
jgi:uncharacterized protein YuzE